MWMTPEKQKFIARLAPPDPTWKGMGCLPLHPDRRDYDLRSEPRIAAQLAAGVPDSADLFRYITGPPDNQGNSPACVAYSTCNLGSLDDVAETGNWEPFNGAALYTEAGGDGSNGVDTRRVLDICVNEGLPGNSGRVKLVASYAFVPQQPGVFRDTIKAAVASGQPVTLALLLPAPFQWNSGNAPTTGYHQVVVVGYDATWAIILNSWGSSWPGDAPAGTPPGVGRVPWDFIEADGMQRNYAYAFGTQRVAIPNPTPVPIPTPVPVPTPTPVPIPAPAATVTGRATSGFSGATWPKVGDTVPFGAGVTLLVETLVYDNPQPTPDPTPTPTPTPIPDPTPVPGALTIRTSVVGSQVEAWVNDANGPVTAICMLSVEGISQGTHRTYVRAEGVLPAVWVTRAKGMATVSATFGRQSGVSPPFEV